MAFRVFDRCDLIKKAQSPDASRGVRHNRGAAKSTLTRWCALGQTQTDSTFPRSYHSHRNVSDEHSDFTRGFVLGQTSVYLEQVNAGAKLAAQIGCSRGHLSDVLLAINEENCEAIVEDREHGRVAIWIYRLPFVRTLIEQISKDATPPTAAGVWAMGKLFSYSDSEIGAYLESHRLIK